MDEAEDVSYDLDGNSPWSTTQRVQSSQIISTLSKDEISLYEAKFEVLTSEASYLKNLKVLERHYMKNAGLGKLISDDDFRTLFENVPRARECSERLMVELTELWRRDMFMNGLCAVIIRHVTQGTYNNFVDYAKHYPKQVDCLKTLVGSGGIFDHFVHALKNHPLSQRLSIESFLILPVQRISRYPLLIESIARYMDDQHPDYESVLDLQDTLRKLARECDAILKKAQNREQMAALSRQLRTPVDMTPVLLVADGRRLINHIRVRKSNIDYRSIRKEILDVFLFNDLIMLAKRSGKSEKQYNLVDYCSLGDVEVVSYRGNSLALTLEKNWKGERVDMVLGFDDGTRDEWVETLEAVRSPSSRYEVVARYKAARKYDLTLAVGDVVVEVEEAPVHGFMQGKNLATGEAGRFPEKCVRKLSKTESKEKAKENSKSGLEIRTTTWYIDKNETEVGLVQPGSPTETVYADPF